jgi:membrane fusion protein (multidrug efflux system)
MKKIFYLSPLLVLLIIVGLTLVKAFQIRQAIAEGSKRGPPTMAVTSMTVKKTTWTSILRTVGSIESIEGAMLSAEETGRISSIPVSDGSRVKKGDLIIELDSNVELAEYQSAKSQSDLLKKTFDRQKRLHQANAISGDEFDTAELNFRAALAKSNALQARVDRRQIRAPFDGTLGVRRVNIGQYVRQGDPLIPLHNMEKIYVSFSLSQDDAKKITLGDRIYVTDGRKDSRKHEAKIIAIDPSISPNTKTSLVKANLLHTDDSLVPGMFINLEIHLSESTEVFSIPSTSIQYAPYGDSVYIIEDKIDEDGTPFKIANPGFIKVIDRRGDMAAVTAGLEEGTEIVTSGTFKLFPGTKVMVNNSVVPGSDLSPTPANR